MVHQAIITKKERVVEMYTFIDPHHAAWYTSYVVQKKKRKNGFILSMCKIASMTILSLFIYLIVYAYMLTNMTINSHHGLYVVQWTINPYMYIQCIDSVY